MMWKSVWAVILVTLLVGCGGKSSFENIPDKSVVKDAAGVLTAGDDQHVLEGKGVKLYASVLDKSKTFDSFIWKEGNTILSQGEECNLEGLTLGVHQITLEVHEVGGVVYRDIIEVVIKKNPAGNTLPIANKLHFVAIEDESFNGGLRGGDADGDPLGYVLVSLPKHGHLEGSAAHLRYVPDPNYFGEDFFYFKTNDGKIDSDLSIVTITVEARNDAPVAKDMQVLTEQNRATTIRLEAEDVEGDTLDFSLLKHPEHGYVSGTPPMVTYTPQKGYIGEDHFSYIATDGIEDSKEAIVTIRVEHSNHAPEMVNQQLQTTTNTPITVTLLGRDEDNDPLTYKALSNPALGTITINGNKLIYTPKLNFYGEDSLTVVANDGLLDSAPATIRIYIAAPSEPLNHVPVAKDQTITLNEDENATLQLNATDLDNDLLSYDIVDLPSHGNVTISGKDVIYTPSPNYFGVDSFTFKANDQKSDSNIATISLSIKSVNDTPIALSQYISVDEDKSTTLVLQGVDIDGDTLSYEIVSYPTFGTLSGTLPNLTYVPSENFYGSDNFTFKVLDKELSSNAEIFITVNSVNDAPIANAGADVTFASGESVILSGSGSDIDGNITAYEWRRGSIVVANSASFSESNLSDGTYLYTLTVEDDKGATASDEVLVTIGSASSSFVAHQYASQGAAIVWHEVADMDSDGDEDVVVISNNGLVWYENHGNWSYSDNFYDMLIDGTANMSALSVADMDKDGYKDILFAAGISSSDIYVCTNSGSKSFSCNKKRSLSYRVNSLKAADIDGDGDKDIVVTSSDSNTIAWLENKGGCVYTNDNIIDTNSLTNPIYSVPFDLNKDGAIDIISAGNGSNSVYWFENSGDGSSFTPHFEDDTIAAISSVEVADIDGDGYSDIITTSNSDGKVYWHANAKTATPSFTIPNVAGVSLTNVQYASGLDMDNDGDIDILSNSNENGGKIVWYENSGNGSSFTEHTIAVGVDNITRVFAVDMDNDGMLDVVAANEAGEVVIFENTSVSDVTLLPKTGDSVVLASGDDASLQKGSFNSLLRDDSAMVVVDQLRGLMWQDDSNASLLSASWSDADNGCQSLTMAGYSDWRLPSAHELYYLLDRSRSSKINPSFRYINTSSDGYWSGSDSDSQKIWIGFLDARSERDSTSSLKYVRCVRGTAFTVSLTRDDTNEVVTDSVHKLQWQDNSDVESNSQNWSAALNYCANLDLDGSGWRLPNANELYSIADPSKVSYSIMFGSTPAFLDTFNYGKAALYWSATGSSEITTIDFTQAIDNNKPSTDAYYVRCVRDLP